MSDFLNRLAENLAARSSRRGFISTMGKVVAGIAATIVGGYVNEGIANAAPNGSLLCCTGTACGGTSCPSGTHLGYTWCCHYEGVPRQSPNYIAVYCKDCYDNGSNNYNCTYAIDANFGC